MDNTLSARINRAFNDPQRDEIALWEMVRDYVGRVCLKWLDQDSINEVVEDVLYQIAVSLPKFEPRDDDSGFTKWICGVCRFRTLNYKREKKLAKEICISQIGTLGSNGEFIEMDLGNLESEMSSAHYTELLDRELKDARNNATLDALRERIPPKNHRMFDLLRSGLSMKAVSVIVGKTRNTVNYHVRTWNKLAPQERLNDERPAAG